MAGGRASQDTFPDASLDRGELLRALRAFKHGDFSMRMPSGLGGVDGEIARAFNDVAAASAAYAEKFNGGFE